MPTTPTKFKVHDMAEETVFKDLNEQRDANTVSNIFTIKAFYTYFSLVLQTIAHQSN